ncbi:hypothetical protein QKW60_16950 [Defluviimonas aestuarii]|uniref:hypothetical protein n=1 Tax=Albidovulum aestuarii TaxID=1130726 RepID=UPI00249C758E|nr:hypothetical protein [Defluviimonas aestuarii]MDI3338099.1 hypothetical protein [Defluviimonas aestuarii]
MAADFPGPAKRVKIAKTVIAAAVDHEEIGLPPKEASRSLAQLRERSQPEGAQEEEREHRASLAEGDAFRLQGT